ncbi:MAG: sulfotransferase, partial [Ferruginibacter sp.]
MNKFFPIPLYSFCKTIYKNGGLSRRGLLHALPWIIKTTALEPLRWCELALYHKKLKFYKIEKGPLFILGYYRSGTTHLQQMFMQDDRLGYTSLYQTIFPELMLSFEKSMTPVLEKIAEVFTTQNHFHRIPLTWFSPGEEDVAMVSLMNSNAAQWGILFPHKAIEIFKKYALFQNIPNKELINWGEDYLYLLKKISLANKGKPLVLKSPLNTVRIQQLLWLFPNARFIYISRNPVDVYASTQRLWKMIIKKYVLG